MNTTDLHKEVSGSAAEAGTRTGVPRDSGTKSLWQENITYPETDDPALLNAETVYDVLIVGGGITGLTTALLLQESGRKCILAEAHTIGYGTTGGTTAHINTFLDSPYSSIEKNFGKENTRLVARACKEAVDLITRLTEKYAIDCSLEYKKGYLYAETDEEAKELDDIFDASQRTGIQVTHSNTIPVPLAFTKAIVFDRQAQFHPLKYISALAVGFVKPGGVLLQQTTVHGTEKAGEYHIAKTDAKDIRARNVIYATHIPPGINILHLRCAPYRSYALAARLADNRYPSDLAYDMKDPYHYVRSQNIDGQTYLIAGGEDHKTGHDQPENSYSALEEYVRRHYSVASIDYRWSSQYYIPSDGLPYIGKLPGADEGIFTATGYSGNGITFGSIAASILHDLVTGTENPYADLFSPSRIKPVAGFTEFVKENADVAWHFVADRLKGKDKTPLDELQPDSAAIVKHHNEKLAVYKDASGILHALNPVCTHARCIVNWNQAEKSWDCPCHGARFDINGNVLTGPADRGLERIELN